MAIDIEWHLRPRELTTTITVHAAGRAVPGGRGVASLVPSPARLAGTRSSCRCRRPSSWCAATDHLPTGEVVPYDAGSGPFDDAFRVPGGRVTVSWPGALAIDVASDSDWYVVFDELASYVCVEPQSGPPDGLHALGRVWDGPGIASPGQSARADHDVDDARPAGLSGGQR